MIFPRGSKKSAHRDSREISPVFVFARIQSSAPAGAAAITALASTKKIRSQTDSRITRQSAVYDRAQFQQKKEGFPFSSVPDKIPEISSVRHTANPITPDRQKSLEQKFSPMRFLQKIWSRS